MSDTTYRPDQPSLTGPRLKLQRGEEQLDQLEPEIRAYSQSQPFRLNTDDPDIEDGWMVIRFVDVRSEPDPRWGVRVGEFLHDLRSALDNLVWQLVLANGEEPGDHNQFPIYASTTPGTPRRGGLPEGATRIDEMLLGVAPEYVTRIKEVQPYLGPGEHEDQKNALGALADLNNIDKHKIVHPAIALTQRDGTNAEPSLVAGPPPTQIVVEHRLGPISEGAEALRWRLIGGTRETRVELRGGVAFDVAFGHPTRRWITSIGCGSESSRSSRASPRRSPTTSRRGATGWPISVRAGPRGAASVCSACCTTP
jgi:hypothetical protein